MEANKETDRELLDLAAKAAGVDITWRDGHPYSISRGYWNPLIDDGDALRLAGKLMISFGPEREDVIGKSLVRVSWERQTHSLGEYGDGNYEVATRRAIVRAAAEIGRSL